jgi:hypothetical protein
MEGKFLDLGGTAHKGWEFERLRRLEKLLTFAPVFGEQINFETLGRRVLV